ncbi:MAG: MarR family transcriptional regulator [Nocardioidaceae bacterium]
MDAREDSIEHDADQNDAVAQIVAQWERERPDLDATPLLVIGQMARLTQLIDVRLRAPFAAAGIGNGDFDVLAALRRAGKPYALTPGQISAALLVTTGAVSKRLDRLEAQRFIDRQVSTDDARSRLVHLTARGLATVDRLIETHLANERRLLSGLDDHEISDLAVLLRRLAQTMP